MTKEGRTDRPHSQNHGKEERKRGDYTAYDRALIKAKETKKLVTFVLATGETCTDCLICSVDKFQIEVEHDSEGPMKSTYSQKKEWFNKALIARTRIQ